MPNIHPTAAVAPGAAIADDVEIGPGCVIEPDVEIGPGCRLREYVILRRYTTLGGGNLVDAFCVLGGEPQDYKFDPATVSHLRIGADNIFRENVTISRATGEGDATVVGDRTYWMVGAHAGHNAVIEDDAILINGAAVGGHATIGRRAILSSHVVVHQYCWIGEGAMTQGNAGFSAHLPPYTMGAGINGVVGLNVVGMRRNPVLSDDDRRQLKEAYRLLYRSGIATRRALAEMDAHQDWGAAAGGFREFIRRAVEAAPPYDRGLSRERSR
jgi:UDP-N-acetylglucosamine acyltransferase